MAKIKSKYATQEDIPEGFGELFTEHDGEWRLTNVESVDGYGVAELKAMQAERNRANKLEKRLKQFGDVDPDQLATDLEELTELRERAGKPDPEATKQWEAKEKQLLDRFQKQNAEKDQRIGSLQSGLYEAIVDTEVARLCAKHGFDPVLAPAHFKQGVRVVENENGKPVAKIYDSEGNVVIAPDGNGDMTLEHRATQWKDDPVYSRLCDAEGREGSGAGGGGGGGPRPSPSSGRPRVIDNMRDASPEDIMSGKAIPRDWIPNIPNLE